MISPSRGVIPLVHPACLPERQRRKKWEQAPREIATSRAGSEPVPVFRRATSASKNRNPRSGLKAPTLKSPIPPFSSPRAAVKLVALESKNVSRHPSEGCRLAGSAMPKTGSCCCSTSRRHSWTGAPARGVGGSGAVAPPTATHDRDGPARRQPGGAAMPITWLRRPAAVRSAAERRTIS